MSLPHQEDTNSVFTHSPHDDSDYIGEATVTVRGTDIPVELELKG